MAKTIIEHIDEEIAQLQCAKRIFLRLSEFAKTHRRELQPQTATPTTRRTRGTAALVLGVMRDGADTLAAIAKGAKITLHTARATVLALEQSGQVTRRGAGSRTRYTASRTP